MADRQRKAQEQLRFVLRSALLGDIASFGEYAEHRAVGVEEWPGRPLYGCAIDDRVSGLDAPLTVTATFDDPTPPVDGVRVSGLDLEILLGERVGAAHTPVRIEHQYRDRCLLER